MELIGKVFQVNDVVSGEGRNGTWKKQEFIVETTGEYPKKICFVLWGNKIDEYQLQSGENVKVFFDIESREYNNRWYTDVKAWKVEKSGAGEGPMDPEPPAFVDAPSPEEFKDVPSGEDDLPF